MILIITNRQDQTADYLILELKRQGIDYIRFNTEDFPQKVSLVWEFYNGLIKGYIKFLNRKVDFDEIKSIWYRRPVSPIPNTGISDLEAQNFIIEESRTALDGVWRTLPCFWVSKPDNIRIAESKMYQLKIASETGLIVWPTTVTNDVEFAKKFYKTYNEDIVYKPLKRGRLAREGKQSFIFTNLITKDNFKDIANIRHAPSLLQKYIHKNVELRTTVIGDKVFTVEIDSQKTQIAIHDWRKALHDHIAHKPFNLPFALQNKCVQLVRNLGLEFGALDFILTPDGEFVFLEINPNGQWAWIQQLCPEIPLRETLADLLINGQPQKG
jgi:glutathione synthase/RimK-type ligase-like ATP-grasp enzyme